jgi:hypothetical protein
MFAASMQLFSSAGNFLPLEKLQASYLGQYFKENSAQ